MDRSKIINTLRHYKREHANEYGILEIGVFGSVARGDVREDSDVDVVLRISKPDLFVLAGIKESSAVALVGVSVAPNSDDRLKKGKLDEGRPSLEVPAGSAGSAVEGLLVKAKSPKKYTSSSGATRALCCAMMPSFISSNSV